METSDSCPKAALKGSALKNCDKIVYIFVVMKSRLNSSPEAYLQLSLGKIVKATPQLVGGVSGNVVVIP